MRCETTSSVKECAPRARSTHGVHHAIVEVNIVSGVVLCELHVIVRVHVIPLCCSCCSWSHAWSHCSCCCCRFRRSHFYIEFSCMEIYSLHNQHGLFVNLRKRIQIHAAEKQLTNTRRPGFVAMLSSITPSTL